MLDGVNCAYRHTLVGSYVLKSKLFKGFRFIAGSGINNQVRLFSGQLRICLWIFQN